MAGRAALLVGLLLVALLIAAAALALPRGRRGAFGGAPPPRFPCAGIQKRLPVRDPWPRDGLWTRVAAVFGEAEASRHFPKTWVLPRDAAKLRDDHDPRRSYIAKGDSEQSIEVDLLGPGELGPLDKYWVVQEYLHPPFLLRGYLLILRMFLVVDCEAGAYLLRRFVVRCAGLPYAAHSRDRRRMMAPIRYPDRKSSPWYPPYQHYLDQRLPRVSDELEAQVPGAESLAPAVAHSLRVLFAAMAPERRRPCRGLQKGAHAFGVDVGVGAGLSPRILELNPAPQLYAPEAEQRGEDDERMVAVKRALTGGMCADIRAQRYPAARWLPVAPAAALRSPPSSG
jgi:hypothetical protein